MNIITTNMLIKKMEIHKECVCVSVKDDNDNWKMKWNEIEAKARKREKNTMLQIHAKSFWPTHTIAHRHTLTLINTTLNICEYCIFKTNEQEDDNNVQRERIKTSKQNKSIDNNDWEACQKRERKKNPRNDLTIEF